MNFQTIPPVETPETILDLALKRGARKAAEERRKLRKGTPLERKAKVEAARFQAIGASLQKSLRTIPTSFPNFEALPELYARLLELSLDVEQLRGALASVATGAKNGERLAREYVRAMRTVPSEASLLRLKREGIGRLSSILKRLGKELSFLAHARTLLRTFPDVKEDAFVVAIAGFPNVGKSTLLNALTGSSAKINTYAFTTKHLNSGSFEYRHHTIQCLDTPGTLSRPEKMNAIEQQAYLAMKYAAHLIIYVYDATEPYPLPDQERLERVIRKYEKPVLLYLSKTDILDQHSIEQFQQEKEVITSVPALKEAIKKIFEEEFAL